MTGGLYILYVLNGIKKKHLTNKSSALYVCLLFNLLYLNIRHKVYFQAIYLFFQQVILSN